MHFHNKLKVPIPTLSGNAFPRYIKLKCTLCSYFDRIFNVDTKLSKYAFSLFGIIMCSICSYKRDNWYSTIPFRGFQVSSIFQWVWKCSYLRDVSLFLRFIFAHTQAGQHAFRGIMWNSPFSDIKWRKFWRGIPSRFLNHLNLWEGKCSHIREFFLSAAWSIHTSWTYQPPVLSENAFLTLSETHRRYIKLECILSLYGYRIFNVDTKLSKYVCGLFGIIMRGIRSYKRDNWHNTAPIRGFQVTSFLVDGECATFLFF